MSGPGEPVTLPEPEPAETAGGAAGELSGMAAETTSTPPIAPPVAPDQQRSIFWPLLFGGAVAAALGAAVLGYGARQGWIDLGPSARIEALEGKLATLDGQLTETRRDLDALRAREPDLSGIEAAIAGLGDATDALSADASALAEGLAAVDPKFAAVGDQLDVLAARVADLAMQPIPAAELPQEVVEAYERKLEELNTALDAHAAALRDAQEARIAALFAAQDTRLAKVQAGIDAKLAQLAAAEEAARAAEAAAAEAARVSAAQAALARIGAALDSGAGFADALAVLRANSEVTVPAVLADLADTGAPALAALQRSFPGAARAALTAATRAAVEDGTIDRFDAFLRTQLGARSLEPREGDDPDAVLSRAEAALGEGDLQAALAEIAALPDTGRQEMAAWIADAERRRDAVAAAAALVEELDSE